MVLCKYFQHGSCRFGTKCSNEHFDVKQIIKTDVEAAINGNQWPLSCFGPFKDKPCIPNFIDDQSFEEIRFLCYESRQKNFFDQFHQQFAKEALEAKNKLKALMQLTPEVVDVVSKVYDAPIEGASGIAVAPTSSNPFGMASSAVGNPHGTVSAVSIFGKPAATPTVASTVFGGNLFGNTSSVGTATGGGSLFGASGSSTFNNTPSQQTSIFAQVAKPTNSIFGGGGPPAASIFGQSQPSATGAVGSGIFAQAASAQTTALGGGNLFAQQTPQQPGYGLFAQAAQQTAPAYSQQNIFGQQQQQNAGLFGQTAQQQVASGNPFGQQTQNQAASAPGGFFSAAAAQTQNLFTQQQQQQQQQLTNIFAQAAQQTQATNLFQQTTSQQSSFMSPAQVVEATPASNVPTSMVYSRMEDLTTDEIEAFQAESFTTGKIPFSPPPRELVN